MTGDSSRILLPLRTSVDLFSDTKQPSALVRAKQAAVLFDTVIVEVGFLDVSVTDHGSSSWWTPPDQIRADQVERARQPAELGSPMTLAIGKQEDPGTPATEMTTVFSGSISMAYGAEWHSEVLLPLEAIGVNFIETITTGGGEISRRHPVGDAIARQNFRDWTDKTLMPGVANSFERDFIYKSFNRDAAVADDLGAALQASTLFAPMLDRHGRGATGTTALEIAIPNLGALEWEQILEFRQHPGAEDARGMLREFERSAMQQEASDAERFLLSVAQQVTAGLLKALSDRQTRLPRAVAQEAAKTGISLVPVVGPFVEKGVTAAQLGVAKRAEKRSGLAALMRLRDGRLS